MALCECGCGNETKPYALHQPARGIFRGQPARFCLGHRKTDLVRIGKKRCKRCKIFKIADAFSKNKAQADGRDTRCKPCSKEWKMERYRKNPERFRQRSRELHEQNPFPRRAAVHRYNKSQHGRERIKIYRKRWLQTPSGILYSRTKHARRKARKLGASGIATQGQIAGRFQLFGSLCWICERPATAMDHVKPLAVGGTNWPANIRPICKQCNGHKHSIWLGVSRLNELKLLVRSKCNV